jgi:hypothetical protein
MIDTREGANERGHLPFTTSSTACCAIVPRSGSRAISGLSGCSGSKA